jgi:hypothetical protein
MHDDDDDGFDRTLVAGRMMIPDTTHACIDQIFFLDYAT